MLSTLFKDFVDDESGATAIEYGLILSLVVIVMIAALQDVATTTVNMWGKVESESITAMSN